MVKILVVYFLSLTFLAFTILGSVDLNAQSRKALLIGVGKYPAEGGWATIHSTNDVGLIKAALNSQGFNDNDIIELLDDKATKKGILNALNNDLLSKVNRGDIIYFQFSGHGQQRPDIDGDEVDGLDECIVSFDSPKKFQEGIYEGENLISDDELNRNLTKIREKLGPKGQLLVVLDACHSGTGTRGAALARGTTEVMASPSFQKQNQLISMKSDNNGLQNKQNKDNLSAALSANLAPMVAFFGSAQNQLNYEMTTETGEHYGSLSYALAKWLVKAKPEDSYRGLFDKIRLEMSTIAPLQQPQAEGELDLEIANGKLLNRTNYYKAINVSSETELSINAGELLGVLVGSEVSLYPPETRDLENIKAIVTGKITQSYPTKSLISLDAPLDISIIKDSWIYVTNKCFGKISIGLGINISDEVIAKQISDLVYSKPYVTKDQINPKIWISYQSISGEPGSIVIKTMDDYLLDSIPLNLNQNLNMLSFKIHKSIKQYLYGDFIRKLELEGSDIKLSFKIIPLDSNGNEKDIEKLKPLMVDASGNKKMALNARFKLLIVNESIKPAYFNVIDIQPDNKINPLLPSDNTTPEEMRILPDQKILFPNEFKIEAPLGHELFKLIGSDKPLDLKSSLGTRGNIQQSPFEKLFNETKSEDAFQSRGGKPVSLPITDIDIYSDTFTIIR